MSAPNATSSPAQRDQPASTQTKLPAIAALPLATRRTHRPVREPVRLVKPSLRQVVLHRDRLLEGRPVLEGRRRDRDRRGDDRAVLVVAARLRVAGAVAAARRGLRASRRAPSRSDLRSALATLRLRAAAAVRPGSRRPAGAGPKSVAQVLRDVAPPAGEEVGRVRRRRGCGRRAGACPGSARRGSLPSVGWNSAWTSCGHQASMSVIAASCSSWPSPFRSRRWPPALRHRRSSEIALRSFADCGCPTARRMVGRSFTARRSSVAGSSIAWTSSREAHLAVAADARLGRGRRSAAGDASGP